MWPHPLLVPPPIKGPYIKLFSDQGVNPSVLPALAGTVQHGMGKNLPKTGCVHKEESDSEDDGDFEVEEGESGSGSSSSEESGSSSSGDEEGSDEEESSEDEAEDKPKGPDPLANHHDTIKSSGFTIHSATVCPLPAAHRQPPPPLSCKTHPTALLPLPLLLPLPFPLPPHKGSKQSPD